MTGTVLTFLLKRVDLVQSRSSCGLDIEYSKETRDISNVETSSTVDMNCLCARIDHGYKNWKLHETMNNEPQLSPDEIRQILEYGRVLAEEVGQLKEEIRHKQETIDSLVKQNEIHVNEKRQLARNPFQRAISTSSITNLPATLLHPVENDETKPPTPRDLGPRSPRSCDDQWHISTLRNEIERAQAQFDAARKKIEELEAKLEEYKRETNLANLHLETSKEHEHRLREELSEAERSIFLLEDDKKKLTKQVESFQEEVRKMHQEQHNYNNEIHAQLKQENSSLMDRIEELERILQETREELNELRMKSNVITIVREKQPEEVVIDEWHELLREKFEQGLQELMEQIIHNEKRNKLNNPLSPRNGFTSIDNEVKQSYFEDYFAMLVLSVKVLLSKEDRYRDLWHHIWFEDRDELYEKCLSEDVEVHNWWVFLFATVQQRLEDSLEELYTSSYEQSFKHTL